MTSAMRVQICPSYLEVSAQAIEDKPSSSGIGLGGLGAPAGSSYYCPVEEEAVESPAVVEDSCWGRGGGPPSGQAETSR